MRASLALVALVGLLASAALAQAPAAKRPVAKAAKTPAAAAKPATRKRPAPPAAKAAAPAAKAATAEKRPPPPPAAPVAIQFMASDTIPLAGEWFAGPPHAPSLVIGPRHRGPDSEMRAVAAEFQRRGFGVLVFALRDSQPVSRERDTLRYAAITSHWVDDMVGALVAARARGDSSTHLFAWGQGLGGVLAVSAAARRLGLCEALAAEDIFPTIDYVMRMRGTAVIPEAVKAQWKVVSGSDEPFSAAARLNLPVYAILVGHGAGDVGDPILTGFRRNRGRTDQWLRPGVDSPAPAPGAAQIDTLSAWFKRWTAFPRGK